MTANFEGKVALVTGGGTGIGRAIALWIAERGGRVVIVGRREKRLLEVVAENSHAISHFVMDLGDWDAQARVLKSLMELHGRLDILINNAAISTTKAFLDHTEQEIGQIIHTNLASTAVLIHKALPHLIASGGNIVNVSSAAGRYCGTPGGLVSAYSASKAGMNHLTRVLASELGVHGVRVNAVAPGLTDTEIAADAIQNPAIVQAVTAATPLGRVGEPQDIAKVIGFLAGNDAAWVTGQLIDATGGFWLTA